MTFSWMKSLVFSVKCVPKGPTDNNSALVQTMAWRWTGDRQVIIWTNDDPVHWPIYVASGGDELTHWGRVMHICIGNLTIIGSDNGLSPGRRQAIIWTNAGILLIGPKNKLQWNFRRNYNIFIQENVFESVLCEMAAIVSRASDAKQGLTWNNKS